jgi:hypothetical protein
MSAGVGRFRRAVRMIRRPYPQPPDIEPLQLALGRHESRYVKSAHFDRIRDAEFRVFSQYGEDGIIQYLIGKVPIEHDVFVTMAEMRVSTCRPRRGSASLTGSRPAKGSADTSCQVA